MRGNGGRTMSIGTQPCPICEASGTRVNMEKCQSCGHIYCFNCDGQNGYGGTSCPECGGDGAIYKKGMHGPDGDDDPVDDGCDSDW